MRPGCAMLRAMGDTSFWPKDERRARKRSRLIRSGLLVALLALTGALLEPTIIAPWGPLASRPERITAEFSRCGRGRSMACVVDGDTIRLGDRRIRILGIDAPELTDARCPGERRSASAPRTAFWRWSTKAISTSSDIASGTRTVTAATSAC